MTKTVKLVATATLVLGLSVAANATTTNLGAVTTGAPTAFSGAVVPSGAFLDVFTFSLPANGGSGYSVMNFPLSIPGVGSFNTVFSSMSLVSNPDGILFNSDDKLLTAATGPGSKLSFSWGSNAGGNMYLSVMGIANGTVGGLYNGAISVSPVPEAHEWAMMIAGLGFIGMVRHKRRTAKSAV